MQTLLERSTTHLALSSVVYLTDSVGLDSIAEIAEEAAIAKAV